MSTSNHDATPSSPSVSLQQAAVHPPDLPPALAELLGVGWDEAKLATGVTVIDEQHRLLIAMIAKLRQMCEGGHDAENLQRVFRFVRHYASSHFTHEEMLMEQRRCPVREANRVAHQDFLKRFETLSEHLDDTANVRRMGVDLCSLLQEWFVNHICTVDMSLRTHGSCARVKD